MAAAAAGAVASCCHCCIWHTTGIVYMHAYERPKSLTWKRIHTCTDNIHRTGAHMGVQRSLDPSDSNKAYLSIC